DHLRLYAVDLAQTELMDLVRRHVGGRPGVDVVFVTPLTIWQRGDRQSCTPLRRVFRTEESGEGLVGRDDVTVNSVADLLGQALLVFRGDARGILLCRKEKGVSLDDALTLEGKLLQEEANGY